MERGGKCAQAKQDAGRGAVEPFVCNAKDAALPHSAQVLPAAPFNDTLERHAITRAAPAEDHRVGIGSSDGLRSGLLGGGAEELSAGSFDQLCDPGLRMDERLAPLFAIDDGAWSVTCGLRAG
jgi:hypothetical protein